MHMNRHICGKGDWCICISMCVCVYVCVHAHTCLSLPVCPGVESDVVCGEILQISEPDATVVRGKNETPWHYQAP